MLSSHLLSGFLSDLSPSCSPTKMSCALSMRAICSTLPLSLIPAVDTAMLNSVKINIVESLSSLKVRMWITRHQFSFL